MDRSEIVSSLIAIEPNLMRLADQLSADDFSTVSELTTDGDPRIRANALTLQSLLDEERFIASFRNAYTDADKLVRLQLLASIDNVSPTTVRELIAPIQELLNDSEITVRKMAVKATLRIGGEEAISMLENVTAREEEPFIRELAKDALSDLK